jgi:hypothetical protein
MRERPVEQPVSLSAAFGRADRAALMSQAALFLLLRAQIRGDAQALAGRSGRRARLAPARDLAELRVPALPPVRRRVSAREVRGVLVRRYGRAHGGGPRRARRVAAPERLTDLAARFARHPTALGAALLMDACLDHAHDLPRAAAAAAYFELCAEPERPLVVLARATRSRDPLARAVAATALAHVAPDDPGLRTLLESRPRGAEGPASHTSLLVHGTFARGSSWWQPGGDFHEYVRAQVRPDLYGAADRFEWSGGYSDAARALGAADLRAWVEARGLEGLDVFTHSHGGSIAMLATQAGLSLGQLVLLSCPVHVPKYLPDFAQATDVVSVRVRLDLVILVDGGGQRFHDARIREHVLPIWFDHFATHDPAVWQDLDVPSLL